MMTLVRIAVAVLLIGVVTLAGCGGNESPTVTSPPSGTTRIDPPGLYAVNNGTSRAVGILDYVDLEGGFWAVTGVASSEGAASTVIAVIANTDAIESELTALRGHYVEVTGRVSDGASTRMAGPEMIADDVRVLEGVTTEDE